MKTILKLCAWLVCLNLWLMGNGEACADQVFIEADNGRMVSVPVGEKIYFDLSGNPSTGYSWLLAMTNGDSVVFTGEAIYTSDNPDTSGGGGVYRFPLQAKKVGASYLEFNYQKAWDAQSVIKQFTISFDVTNAAPRLSLSRVESGLVLAWPMDGNEGYYLEGTTSLAAPQWQALNILVRSDGTNYWAEVKPTGNATYYRLRN